MNLRLSDRLREHLINGLSDGRWVGIFTYAFSENGPERIVAVLRAYEAVKEELESRQAYQSGDGFAYHVKLAVTTGFITPQAAHVVKGWSKRSIGVRNAAAHESRTVPWTESAAVAAFWHHVYSDLNRSTPHRSTSRMVQQLFELDEVLRQTDVGAGAVRSNSDMPRCFAVGSGVRGLSSIVLALRDDIDAKKTGQKPQSRIEIVADIVTPA
ncbi:hypothetical protein KBC55_00205 [Patescibacteria group bacterium]|nr:hypothetical protein [Patescibacteria group bacterium]